MVETRNTSASRGPKGKSTELNPLNDPEALLRRPRVAPLSITNLTMSFGSIQQGSMMARPSSSTELYRRQDLDPRAHSASNNNNNFQIYSAVYSGVNVYEMEVNNIAVMRRRDDSWLNATQILKVAGIEKGKRTKVLEKEILIGEHEKIQGGYGKYQGTWIKFERGVEFCRQYHVEDLLRPLLTYDMGQDGGVAGQGGKDTPTKEQAMAANRKKMYNAKSGPDTENKPAALYKSISATALNAVGAIGKARNDSPSMRTSIGGSRLISRGPFSRQNSQQNLGSQETGFPGNSQQSMQSFTSADSFNGSQQDSAYATQFSRHAREDFNGDFDEPPRKRMRETPVNDSQATIQDDQMMSMREVSPTEPNESFMDYQHVQANGEYVAVPPLRLPDTPTVNHKTRLLMSLFTDKNLDREENIMKHPVFTTLSREDLDMPVDATSNTALIWAATLGRPPLMRVLVARGANIFRVNEGGETALMRACLVTNNSEKGTFGEVMEILGPTIQIRDAKNRTMLHHLAITSAVKGRSSASKYYLDTLYEYLCRQNNSAPNSQEVTPQNPNLQVMGLTSIGLGRFISEIVNHQDRSGDTALCLAARIGNRSVIQGLIEVGADVTIPNRSNLSPVDFGVGDRADLERARARVLSKPVGNDEKQSSSQIISSITSLLTETEAEFAEEIKKKQIVIDDLHANLREASGELGERRRRLNDLKAEASECDLRKLKLGNLKRARDEEQVNLQQLQDQYQLDSTPPTTDLVIGDADKAFAIPEKALAILKKFDFSSDQPLILDRNDRAILEALLPSAQVLRARVAALKANNKGLAHNVQELKIKDSELSDYYRKIIALCTGVHEKKVDDQMHTILKSLESESQDLPSTRVREFLTRMSGD